MALTQSARLAGPSWDEEVVPALRKRLESESRTLAKRISAISLSSVDETIPPTFSSLITAQQRQPSPLGASRQPVPQTRPKVQQQYSDQTITTGISRVNGTNIGKSTESTPFQRARTYSSPYASDLPNGVARSRMATAKVTDPSRSTSPRLDLKPTRIPKPARPPLPSASSGASPPPSTNGHSHSNSVTPTFQSPELPYQTPSDLGGSQRGAPVPASASGSTIELSNRSHRTPGLLNESPPFPTDSTMSSGFSQDKYMVQQPQIEEEPPRSSVDSQEQPFEHWYRGEVSRNGGVGELRVGRRQEMLDIANYGHLVERKKGGLQDRIPPMSPSNINTFRRKRAGSIGGVTDVIRERGSLYLDEDGANEVGRVMDEHPLTDLEGETSDVNSLSDQYATIRRGNTVAYAFVPEEEDVAASAQWSTTAGAHEIRSTTPTPTNLQTRSISKQNLPPSRIPGPSSRRSSESRSTTTPSPATTNGVISRGASEPVHPSTSPASSASTSKMPSLTSPTTPTQNRQGYASNTVPVAKRGVSPAAKKGRTPTKPKAKTLVPSKKDDRLSVAHYPTPDGDDEDMADAIPSWTQPVHKEGNWDEVVLPVVARKKGLDDHYENADGAQQPKKAEKRVEPAPGTFGYDHTKYRQHPQGDNFETIPMDEFGRPAQQEGKSVEEGTNGEGRSDVADDLRKLRPTAPSPAPFSQYAPMAVEVRHAGQRQKPPEISQDEPPEQEAGCCKCVIM